MADKLEKFPVVAILGGGQLGSRHLQALSLVLQQMEIWVIDPREESRTTAHQRWEEVAGEAGRRHNVRFAENASDLPHRVDVAIIATNADVRRPVTEALLAGHELGAVVFEKVLFPAEADYAAVSRLLRANRVSAWVNCPRRIWKSYQSLKERIGNRRVYSLEASGSLWGLGCNSIHMVDLLAWISSACNIKVDHVKLSPEIIPAKRAGFVEFTGVMVGHTDKGAMFSLSAWPSVGIPFTLKITAENLVAEIREDEGKAWVATSDNNWVWCEESVHQEFQSQLTHTVVEKIIRGEDPGLTPYEESVQLHLPLILAFLDHLKTARNQSWLSECPIT